MTSKVTRPGINLDRFSLPLWLVCLVLCALIYAPSMRGDFILDDSHTIQTNDAIQNPQNLFKLWTSARFYSSSPDNWGYRPVQAFLNAVCWQAGGGATWPFHAVKVLLFSGLVTFFILIWRRLLPRALPLAVVGGGLFFLIAPVQTQVVSYIAATSTLLAALFGAMSLWFYLRHRAEGHLRLLLLSGLTLFIAMLGKEEGIVIVGVLPVLEMYLRLRDNGRLNLRARDLLLFWPHVLAVVAALGLIVLMFEPTSDLARGDMSRWLYFVTQWRAWLRYMLLYFVPFELNADNLNFGFSDSALEPRALMALAVNVLLIAGAVWAFCKKHYLPLFCLTWFYGAIAPASSIVVLAEPVNDHRALIAYLGWGGLLIAVLDFCLRRAPRLTKVSFTVLLISYSGLSIARNVVWSSNSLLWEDTLAKNPNSVRAHNNASLNSMHTKDWQRAGEILDSCLKLEPHYAYCLINRALVGISRGEEDYAEQLLVRAMADDFAGVHGRRYYAEFLYSRGRFNEGLKYAEEAEGAAKGQNLFVRILLIRLHLSRGEKSTARKIWENTFEIYGADPALMAVDAETRDVDSEDVDTKDVETQ